MNSSTQESPVTKWGHVAMSQSVGPNPESETGWGLIRTVHAGVSYNSSIKLPFRWKPVGRQRYFLGLEEETLRKGLSLRQFSSLLQAEATHERLAQLDAIVEQLLSSTETLHGERRQLGMVTGDNVLWFGGDNLALLDHGFFAESTLVPPVWLRNPPVDHVLWDAPVAKQQLKSQVQTEMNVVEDSRILIRIFQGLMINVWRQDLASGEVLRREYKTQSTQLWHELRTLLNATAPDTFAKLAKVVRARKLSSHFYSPPISNGDSKPEGGNLVLKTLGLMVVAVGTLGALWQFQVWPFTPPAKPVAIGGSPTPPIGETEESNESELLKKLEEIPLPADPVVVSDPQQLFAVVGALGQESHRLKELDAIPGSKNPEVAKQEQVKLKQLRQHFLDQWAISFPKANQVFQSETTREDGYKNLKALRDHLLSVRKLSSLRDISEIQQKEQQCLELLQALRFDTRLPEDFRNSLLLP